MSARCILESPGGTDAPARVRWALEHELGRDLDADGLYSLRLLASEIVTNSVVHAGLDADGWVTVSVERRRSRVRVELRDSATHVEPAPRDPDRIGGGGFGLHLVDLLAASWGVERGERMCVWFELDRRRKERSRGSSTGARLRATVARPLRAVALTS